LYNVASKLLPVARSINNVTHPVIVALLLFGEASKWRPPAQQVAVHLDRRAEAIGISLACAHPLPVGFCPRSGH
jgi:hypothetical protein